MSEPLRPTTVSVGPTTATGPGGSIYDLGYQSYTGPRLGRSAATIALYKHAFRAAFGVGRPGRAKIAPLALALIAVVPAILAVVFAAVEAQAGAGDAFDARFPVNYENYHSLTVTLLMLFCAAQAPEIFGRDQRFGVLPLYFSRALTRSDYALAKVAGLMTALFVVDLLPQLVLFVGRVLVAPDPVTGLQREAPALPRFLLQCLLTAGLLGGLSGLIAAWTPRRAYATAMIIGVSIIPPVVVSLVASLNGGDTARLVILLSPGDILDGANAWLFGTRLDNVILASLDVPGLFFVATALIGALVSVGLTVRRYRRIVL
jgi:ABC-2 type transport system permease protein